MRNITESGQTWNVNNPRHCHLVDMYGQKYLPKNLGFTLIFHPPKEKKLYLQPKQSFEPLKLCHFEGGLRAELTFQALTPKPYKL